MKMVVKIQVGWTCLYKWAFLFPEKFYTYRDSLWVLELASGFVFVCLHSAFGDGSCFLITAVVKEMQDGANPVHSPLSLANADLSPVPLREGPWFLSRMREWARVKDKKKSLLEKE